MKKLIVSVLSVLLFGAAPVHAAAPEAVLATWYNVLLNLVRHTATYSPPVASRAFAYVGITAYEATASGNDKLQSLAGQLNARAPNALASIKELVNDAAANPLSMQLASERDHFVRNLHHPNGAEGIEAFLQKRTPHYR